MKSSNIRTTTLLIAIGLLLSAFTQHCYCTTSLCGDSLAVFIFGIFGVFFGGAGLCWLANPLLILSWITIKNNKLSLLCSLLALLLATSFLFFDGVIDDEAGHYRKIISYELGYWLWLGSSLATLIGNVVIQRREKHLSSLS